MVKKLKHLINHFKIKQKIILLVMFVSTLSTLIATSIYMIKNYSDEKKKLLQNVEMLTEIIGNNCAAAILFNVPEDAYAVLQTLKVKKMIMGAEILLPEDGSIFSEIHWKGQTFSHPINDFSQDHSIIIDNQIVIGKVIWLNGQKLAYISLHYSLQDLRSNFLKNLFIAIPVLIIGILIALILSNYLQKFISQPIIDLTSTANKISESKKYSLRTEVIGSDEISILARTFNTMLDTIEQEHKELLKIIDENISLASAIEYAADDIMIIGQNNLIEYVNKSFIQTSGYSKKEIIGKHPNILKSRYSQKEKTDIDVWDEIMKEANWTGRLINITKSGKEIIEDATVSPIKNISGKNIGYVSVQRNISEQLVLEEKQRQSQKLQAIGTLAGGIAHDFNNILTIIFGYCEFSLDSQSDPQQISENIEKIMTAAERARDLISQILTFSRKNESKLDKIQIEPIVEETMSLIKAALPSSIKIKSDIHSKAWIYGDESQIHQILMNLLTNAGYAMQRKTHGTLSVTVKEIEIDKYSLQNNMEATPGPYLNLIISDTGSGIPKDIQDRIFEPFFTTKSEDGGTGLGLSVVHGIISKHNGFINVYSEPDIGTTFNIYFPVVDSMQEKEIKEIEIPKGRGEHILLVDDEKELITIGIHIFETLGYKVSAFNDSSIAFQEFSKDPHKYDLIFTDMTMPNITGVELIKKIKEINSKIPCILYSGYSSDFDNINKLKDYQIDAFVEKPVLISSVALIIREVLDKQ
ncbi:MAG: response regulator [Candidatus Marinimicrobia bacterium]|nr:response regulator [Candidatus Neomarinimicrobiota bacterium]